MTRSRTSAATASRASKRARRRARPGRVRARARRPVRRQRPDRRPRRRAGRRPARRRARPRPARALRRGLQPPRGRRRAHRHDVHARPPGRRRLPRLPAGLAPAARRVPARPVHGDHGRRGRRADVQRRASASARACSCRCACPGAKFFTGDPHYVREGAFALEAPLRATFRLTVLPARVRASTPNVADYWVARTRLDEPMRRSMRRVARPTSPRSSACRARWRSPT